MKKITLWDGYEVQINEQLLDDFDFISDLNTARKENDVAEITAMYFAVIGGAEVYNDVREHITKEKGYFSQTELMKIIEKVNTAFPKAGNRAQRRSWSTTE